MLPPGLVVPTRSGPSNVRVPPGKINNKSGTEQSNVNDNNDHYTA